jgi:H+/gluconate symporter-like permease
MEWFGVLGIVVALVVFVVLAMRSYNVMVTAPLCALIIIITNGMDVVDFFLVDPKQSYLSGVGGFVTKNLLIFLLSALLGKYIEVSGAAKSIANTMIKVVGKDSPFKMLMGVLLIGAVLTYGGVSMFVVMFAIIPLARPLFKEFNLPWHLFVVPFAAGTSSFTMAMLPGTPGLQNVIPAQAMGTPLTAAAPLGLIAAVVTFGYTVFYMKRQLNKSLAKGEVYSGSFYGKETDVAVDDEKKLPSFGVSVAPLIVLIVILIGGSQARIANIIYIGLVISIVLSAILFRNYIKSQKEVLGGGAQGSLQPILYTAAAVGIGAVIGAAPGFGIINEAIANMPGGPLVSAATLSGVLAGIIGSGSGALGIVTQFFLDPYLATGVNPEVLHRVISISASTYGALPNSGAMFGMFAAMALTHKEAYKHMFNVVVVGQTMALVVIIALSGIFY